MLLKKDEERDAMLEERARAFKARVQEEYEEAHAAGKSNGQAQARAKAEAERILQERREADQRAIDGKLQRLDEIKQVRSTAMALRAEESRLRRIKREAEIRRVERQKNAAIEQRLQDIEERDAKQRKDRRAQQEIVQSKKDMARVFFVKKKQIKEKMGMMAIVPSQPGY
jgi:hypothetical protein